MDRRLKLSSRPASPPLELPSPCRMCPDILVNYEALLDQIKEAHILNCCDYCNYWDESIGHVLDLQRENHPVIDYEAAELDGTLLLQPHHFVYYDEVTQW